MTNLDADYFDGWYADMAGVQVIEHAQQIYLGLPPELLSTSLLSLTGVREMATTLRLSASARLLDLACGRGGYGLWLAREFGCALVGVDFSSVAIGVARGLVDRFELGPSRVDFVVGDLVATGLPAASVDAVICVDAIQFAAEPADCAREVRRLLRPGGRAAFTTWQARDPDGVLPERLRRLDLDAALRAADFAEVRVESRPDWLQAERAYWEYAVTHDPGDDPAMQSWVSEGQRSLGWHAHMERVVAYVTS